MPLPFTARSLDPDAAAFCARSGASDRAALSAFARGVKDLGLWDSMVCWPLRSEQNAGTGTTAYSLGGLGTFDGTLVNGPSWGVGGLTVDADNEYVTHSAGRDFGTDPFSFGSCWKQVSFGTSAFTLGLYPESATSAAYDLGIGSSGLSDAVIRNNSTTGGISRVAAGQLTADTFAFCSASRNDSTLVSYFNGSSVGTASTLASGVDFSRTDISSVFCGRQTNSALARNAHTHAFVFLVKGEAVDPSQLYTLYKSTLGTGLGLP